MNILDRPNKYDHSSFYFYYYINRQYLSFSIMLFHPPLLLLRPCYLFVVVVFVCCRGICLLSSSLLFRISSSIVHVRRDEEGTGGTKCRWWEIIAWMIYHSPKRVANLTWTNCVSWVSLCKVYHWWWMVIDTSTPRANQAWIPSTQQSHYPPFITQFPPDYCCISRHALSALHHQFFVVQKGCFEAVLGGRFRMACDGSFSLSYVFSLLPLSHYRILTQ